ncbi:hypothetical protein ABZ601_25150 [Streptomyces sp. NPDC012842]|uniref:hypothetical protein n=1 Tax=Streptomyces TaxID=1883 RepID=UPI0033DB78D6
MAWAGSSRTTTRTVIFGPPVIARLTGGTAGTGYGKASLRSSWAGGLERIPDLEFEGIGVRAGVDALVIDYRRRIGTGCARC